MGRPGRRIFEVAVFFGLLLALSGCAPRLLTQRVDIHRTGRPPEGDLTAVISRVDFRPTNMRPVPPVAVEKFKTSIANSLYNTGAFREVVFEKAPAGVPPEKLLYFDITATPKESGKYRWIWAWPIFTPPGWLWWPIQPKVGEVSLSLSFSVSRNSGAPVSLTIEKSQHYDVLIYGFYFTFSVEEALTQCYHQALEDLTARVREIAGGVPGASPEKMNVAVIDLSAEGIPAGAARTLSDKLRGALWESGRYQVLERGQMESILKEQGFQQTGCTDQSCMVEIGQLVGVTGLVAGSIGKVGGVYLISLRLIDVAKGTILKSVSQEVEGSESDLLRTGIPEAARRLASN